MKEENKVIFVISDLIYRAPRLVKQIEALKDIGYTITVLCWDRDCKTSGSPKEAINNNCKEVRLRLKTTYDIKRFFLIPIWWSFIFFWLMTRRWNVVHVVNADSILPAIVAGKIKNKPVIFDILDVEIDMLSLPHRLRQIFIGIYKIFMRFASAVIITNEARIDEFGNIPNNNLVVIYNSPPDIYNRSNVNIQEDNIFNIFYAGVLTKRATRKVHIDKLLSAIENINGVKVTIAGSGDLVEDIQEWIKRNPGKAELLGWISVDEVLKRTLQADLLVCLYDSNVLNNKYAAGNKVFQAMMCGKPILVSKDTAVADIITKENCGLVVNPKNVKEIEAAIKRLKKDPQLCHQLGVNGRRAYEQKYSWEIMKQRLIALYLKIGKDTT